MKRHSPHWGGVAKEANREDMGTTGRMLSPSAECPSNKHPRTSSREVRARAPH